MEGRRLIVAGAPRGFLDRGEFLSRGSVERGGKKVWLPRDPFFEPRLQVEGAAGAGPRSERAEAGGGLLPPAPPSGPARSEPFKRTMDLFRLSPAGRAGENLTSLEDGGTRLVITGQQPGFLTGPLYTIYKAASAAAAAAHLQELTGRRHVPVFWVASEDHDLDEARSARFPGPEGMTAEFSLPHAADRRPLSDYPVDRAAEETIECALKNLQGRRHFEEARALADIYRGRDLAGGFAGILAALFEPRGLLPIEPGSLRTLAAPIIRRCLEEPEELLFRIDAGIREVEGRIAQAQVSDRFPLFLMEGGRRHHLSFEGVDGAGRKRFLLEGVGRTFESRDLLGILDAEPERFSPGALLRPVVQNAVLPNVVYIGGPAEIAYFAQLRPVFEWFGLPPPGIAMRLSATLIEGKVARQMRRLGLWPEGAEGARRWSRAQGPEDLLPPPADGPESPLASLAKEVRGRILEAIADPRIGGEPRRRLEAAAEKIASEIERLGSRASREVRRSSGEDLLAATRIYRNFFPDGVLQERRWNILYYVAKYGTGWIEDLVHEIERDPFRIDHRWVFFPPEGGGAEAEE